VFIPRYSTEQVPEEDEVCSPEAQDSELAVRPPLFPKDLDLHHCMVTAAKAAVELHIPHQTLLVREKEVQHSISPCGLLYHLEKAVITRNLLDCSCTAVSYFQQILGWLKTP